MTARFGMDLTNKQGRREQGQRIQRAVERAGLSIEELAGRIGCSRALIYQYLSGSTLAQPDKLQQIAFECGVPLTYFYGDSDDTSDAPTAIEPSPALPTSQEMTARLAESLRNLQELAEAQESGPDYRGLALTCERILSLAGQLGDRVAQSRAQLRLGISLNKIAEFPRAALALERAVALSQESGDANGETSARQSLGKAFLAMGRTREAQEQFARIADGPVFSGRWQGTLSLGSILAQHGDYAEAMQRFEEAAAILEEGEAEGLATAREAASGLLYVTTNRRNIYMNGGDFSTSRQLAEKGLADAEAQGNADQHLEARFDLAWCDLSTGRWSEAWRGLTTLIPLARFVGDQGRETMARAWLGIFLAGAGDFETAISHGKDALATALSRGDRRAELYAQLALADAYTGQTLRDGEARYHTNQALAVAMSLRHDRAEIECRLRLARLSAQIGDAVELSDSATRALTLAERLGARHLESLARVWITETYLAGGQTQEAFAEAERARQIADEIGFIEARWRSQDVLARTARMGNAPDAAAEEIALRAAIEILEALRAGLLAAGLDDTLLENPDCLSLYRRLVALLLQTDRRDDAEDFVEQTGWPPLQTSLATLPNPTVLPS